MLGLVGVKFVEIFCIVFVGLVGGIFIFIMLMVFFDVLFFFSFFLNGIDLNGLLVLND